MEDTRRHRNIRLLFGYERLNYYLRQPSFYRGYAYTETMAALEMQKKSVCLNKPRYVGATILALAKYIMYHYHYNVIKKRFPGEQSSLLFTDTGIMN